MVNEEYGSQNLSFWEIFMKFFKPLMDFIRNNAQWYFGKFSDNNVTDDYAVCFRNVIICSLFQSHS
jgi:hypothetical protein